MKTAIIIHGMPSEEEHNSDPRNSEKHWLPWLKRSLEENGIQAHTPEMPEPYNPRYERWKEVFESYQVKEDTVLVGHSCGAGFIVRWLSENRDVRVGKVVLVAPWLDPEKHMDVPRMFDFEIDADLAKRTEKTIVMYSLDDDPQNFASAKLLKERLKGVEFQEFNDKGHFCLEDLGTEEFPELLENILK